MFKSPSWKYFSKVKKSEAKCKICNKVIVICGNTTNFWTHSKLHGITKSGNSTSGAEDTDQNNPDDPLPLQEVRLSVASFISQAMFCALAHLLHFMVNFTHISVVDTHRSFHKIHTIQPVKRCDLASTPSQIFKFWERIWEVAKLYWSQQCFLVRLYLKSCLWLSCLLLCSSSYKTLSSHFAALIRWTTSCNTR